MADQIKTFRVNAYAQSGAEGKRLVAVEAAIDLIIARVSSEGADLEAEMSRLSKYADQIQEAVKIK
ncbi:MAG: hypothetical protein ACOKSU_26095 [Pseudomonas sp.]|uniref:hypothetical protein n=1 Tax=Pseudomonas TaxID=286 RepID=UPI0003C06CD5|nr:hypothetical protein [Pseudomonas sp. VLB120]AGZ34699.1 hypothetical protein PVLB_09505 [Pseudomonas sp. VLB120]